MTTKRKFTPIPQKSKLLNRVTTEYIPQTTQLTNISEQDKDEGVNNIIITRTGKERTTGCREQERMITDHLRYRCGLKNANM